MRAGDVGRGRGSGKALLRRQRSEIHSTGSLRKMRRQCVFNAALARSGQKGRLRNGTGPVLRTAAGREPPRRIVVGFSPPKCVQAI
jgi:hypothetical protein